MQKLFHSLPSSNALTSQPIFTSAFFRLLYSAYLLLFWLFVTKNNDMLSCFQKSLYKSLLNFLIAFLSLIAVSGCNSNSQSSSPAADSASINNDSTAHADSAAVNTKS